MNGISTSSSTPSPAISSALTSVEVRSCGGSSRLQHLERMRIERDHATRAAVGATPLRSALRSPGDGRDGHRRRSRRRACVPRGAGGRYPSCTADVHQADSTVTGFSESVAWLRQARPARRRTVSRIGPCAAFRLLAGRFDRRSHVRHGAASSGASGARAGSPRALRAARAARRRVLRAGRGRSPVRSSVSQYAPAPDRARRGRRRAGARTCRSSSRARARRPGPLRRTQQLEPAHVDVAHRRLELLPAPRLSVEPLTPHLYRRREGHALPDRLPVSCGNAASDRLLGRRARGRMRSRSDRPCQRSRRSAQSCGRSFGKVTK